MYTEEFFISKGVYRSQCQSFLACQARVFLGPVRISARVNQHNFREERDSLVHFTNMIL